MKNTLFIFLVSYNLACFSQAEVQHPIDSLREACLSIDSNQTTSGMCACEIYTQEKWELELNIVYKKVMKILPAEDKTLLQQSQRDWLSHREKELKFIRERYYKMDGSMWKFISARYITEITRNRVLEIGNYLFLGE